MRVHWQENGIVLTALAVTVGLALAGAERWIERRTQSPIVVAIAAGAAGDDEGDERDATRLATVPLYGSLGELNARAQALLKEPQPNADLLHELARQARVFRAYELADSLLARSLELDPKRVDSLFLRGRTQSDLGRADEAIRLYGMVLAQSPNHQKATYNLGVVSRRAGDYARAETLLTQAVAISSGRIKSKALHQLGLTHGAMGRWDAAAKDLRDAAGLRPDMARIWVDLGHAEMKRDRLDEAQAAYEKALVVDKRMADAHVAMGILQDERGNHTSALSHLTRATRLESGNPATRKALAAHYLERGDAARARANYEWLFRNADDEGDRAYAGSMLGLLSHDTKLMLAELKRADALRPGGYDEAVEQAANALYEARQYERARALLATLLNRPAPSAEVLLAAARTASRLGQWSDAEALLRRSLKARPGSSEAWFQLGRVLSERDDSKGAIDAYRASLARNPDARNTRLNLAVLLGRSGDERKALELYAQLLKAHPRYTPALVNRARLHEREGRVAEAVADLEVAMRVAPGDSGVREQLARLLLRRGETDRARTLLSDAVAETPADPQVRLLLAETELRAGRRADAIAELNRAAALAGDDKQLWARLARGYRNAGDAASATRADYRARPKPGAGGSAATNADGQTTGAN